MGLLTYLVYFQNPIAHPSSPLHPPQAPSPPGSLLAMHTSSSMPIPIRGIVISYPIPISISLSPTKGKQHHANIHLDSDNEHHRMILEPTSPKKSLVGQVLKASLAHQSLYIQVSYIGPLAY